MIVSFRKEQKGGEDGEFELKWGAEGQGVEVLKECEDY